MTAQPPATPGYAGPPHGGDQPKGLAITSLVLGIVSFLVCCITPILGILTGLGAIITGWLGRSRAREGRAGGEGMAMAGLILGIVAVVLNLLLLILGILGYAYADRIEAWSQQQIEQQEAETGGGDPQLSPAPGSGATPGQDTEPAPGVPVE